MAITIEFFFVWFREINSCPASHGHFRCTHAWLSRIWACAFLSNPNSFLRTTRLKADETLGFISETVTAAYFLWNK
jgi:hypothetical protein